MNVGGVEIEVVRDNLTLRTTIADGANTATDESSLCKRFSNDLGTSYMYLYGLAVTAWKCVCKGVCN